MTSKTELRRRLRIAARSVREAVELTAERERAAVVRWLREQDQEALADAIECGEHVMERDE